MLLVGDIVARNKIRSMIRLAVLLCRTMIWKECILRFTDIRHGNTEYTRSFQWILRIVTACNVCLEKRV